MINWKEKLTKLTALLDNQDIADILLVWSGFKPGVLIEVSYPLKNSKSKKKFKETIKELEEILNGLKLKYKLKLNYHDTTNKQGKYTCIARNEKILKKLILALSEKDTKKRRLKTGSLLGYPRSAVVAFSNSNSLDNHNLPPKILKRKYFKFLTFRLSQNWQKEIKYLKEKANKIKKISPELYKRISGSRGTA